MSQALSWTPSTPPRPTIVEAAGRTHPGLCRNGNEDAFAIRPEAGLLAVADGMSGHPAGEIASRMAVETICAQLLDPAEPQASAAQLPPRVAVAVLVAAVQRANLAIFTAGQAAPERRGMGTTVVAALAVRGGVVVAHVGDSRAYLLREHWLVRLTEDHTVRNTPHGPGWNPYRFACATEYLSALTRALGTAPVVEVETRIVSPRRGDVLLLCSDGLTNVLDDQEIAAILAAHHDLDVAAGQLIARTNDNGGPDNVTVALQRWT